MLEQEERRAEELRKQDEERKQREVGRLLVAKQRLAKERKKKHKERLRAAEERRQRDEMEVDEVVPEAGCCNMVIIYSSICSLEHFLFNSRIHLICLKNYKIYLNIFLIAQFFRIKLSRYLVKCYRPLDIFSTFFYIFYPNC